MRRGRSHAELPDIYQDKTNFVLLKWPKLVFNTRALRFKTPKVPAFGKCIYVCSGVGIFREFSLIA